MLYYTGSVVDLVALLVSALSLPIAICNAYVTALLWGLGCTVVSGVIKSAVSDTVSCVETDYTWTLTSASDYTHTKKAYGQSYYITDVKSAVSGNTYYEGYVPKDWGDTYLSTSFHDMMFNWFVWEVAGWS